METSNKQKVVALLKSIETEASEPDKLTRLPNIGKTLAEKLIMAGITNEQELITIGSENAIIKISGIENNDVCINMLYALEGAIQGIRWHNLDNYRKQELREFYYRLLKQP